MILRFPLVIKTTLCSNWLDQPKYREEYLKPYASMYYFHSPKTVLGEPDMKKDKVVVLFLKHELNTLCLCKLWAISFPMPWLARTSEN